jgi:hypothetical protein
MLFNWLARLIAILLGAVNNVGTWDWYTSTKEVNFLFEIHAVQRKRSQHARTLTPMNTRTQTLCLWAPPKDWAPADLEIPEVTNGVSSSTGTSLTT